LRVIRDRLESGEIDETGGHTPPKGIRNVTMPTAAHDDETGEFTPPSGTPVPTSHHPAARAAAAQPPAPPVSDAASPAPRVPVPPSAPPPPVEQFFSGGDPSVPPSMLPVERSEYSAGDVCALARLTPRQLGELESFGIVAATGSGPNAVYSPADLEVARVAARFYEHGVEPRHLRAWRQAADREAALFEQVVAPFIRQRNPQSRQQAADTLRQLSALGADLRAALLRAALQAYLDD
jgi:DNA-binding transcriptional MerR regulator